MAEWNYTSMNNPLYGLNVPQSSQPQFGGSSNNYFNQPFNVAPTYASLNCYGSTPSEWYQFGNQMVQCSSSIQISSTANNTGNQVLQPTLSESQQKWLNMVNQKRLDQQFLDDFIRARVRQSQSPLVQLSEFRDLVQESKILSKKLSDHLNSVKDIETSQDRKDSSEIAFIKERLEFVMEQLNDNATSKEVQEKINKRKEKRKWIKRRKERQRKEAELASVKRDQLNKTIDEERAVLKQKEIMQKKVQEARRETDVVLSDVRQKTIETKRLRQLLRSLRELRSLRARSLESQCGLFSREEDTSYFNQLMEKLDFVVQKQFENYEREEKTLRSTLDSKIETKKTGDAIQKQWEEYSLNIIAQK